MNRTRTRRRLLALVPVAAVGVLALTGCDPLQAGSAAVVAKSRVTESQVDADAKAVLAQLIVRFDAAAAWDAHALETIVREFAEAGGLKLGKVAQPLRAALTGRAVSPPVFDVMAVLGKTEALARLRDHA